MPTELPRHDILTVYGADWCGDCRTATRYLDERSIRYRYIDLEQHADVARRLADAGYRAIPVVVAPDGTVLVEPSTRELARLVGRAQG